jgi:hypothetical protein
MASKKANSNLLKEAIADAKAVRETALKNAELAIQEALTPRLQSIISRKIQAEMEHDEEDMDMEEELDSSDIGMGDNVEPEYTSDTELDPETDEETADVGEEDENLEVIDDLTEEDDMDDVTGASFDIDEEEEYDEDEMDLEEIIRELEDELEESDVDMGDTNMDDEDDDEEIELDLEEEDDMEMSEEEDEEFNLDEILREMGYGDDEDEMSEEDDMSNTEEMEAELEEAYKTINVLKKTINEVNLLNAKLLYANKVFRQYNLTNEQKIKIVESFDRTSTVREVKLVFATISESMKLAGSKKMKNLTEGFASKASKSTAPKGILKENVDFSVTEFQKRNQELAGIIKKN